jgi:hypothetical protein
MRLAKPWFALALVMAGALAAGAGRAGAQSAEAILRYDVAIQIQRDDSIVVREMIDYDFGTAPRHGIFRDIPTTLRYDDAHDRTYPLDVVSVTGSPGTPVQYETGDAEAGRTRIRIGDPDRTITGRHTYVITYRMGAALNGFPHHDELYWNAIGADWSVPIQQAKVTVSAPGPIDRIACYAGPAGSSLPCAKSALNGGVASFAQPSLDPYGALTVVVGLPKGIGAEPAPILRKRWTLGRAFTATPLTVGGTLLLAALVVGVFGRMVWRTGRDRRYRGSQVDVLIGAPEGTPEQAVPLFEVDESGPVEFAPPLDLRPGQIGTLVDEMANPLDVTATVIDLAVRKYLVIEEIAKKGWFGKPDWKLTKLKDPDRELLEYERELLDGLFEDGREVKLSNLRTKFVSRLHRVQDALYRNAVGQGWFAGRPDRVRGRWVAAGSGSSSSAECLSSQRSDGPDWPCSQSR